MKAVQFSVSFAFSDTPQQCYKVSNKHLKQERKKKKKQEKTTRKENEAFELRRRFEGQR